MTRPETLADLRLLAALPARLLAAGLALVAAGCSGSVDPSPHVVDPTRITVLPDNAVMYSGLPTTFVISGGTGSYLMASSNQAVLPVAGNIQGRSIALVPNPVIADTAVTLTVRDTGTTAPVTATVVVKPGTVNNVITITPSATQDASCSPAVCSGGDAEVSATISQGGIPLAARGVRFEVVSGDFRIITTLPGVTPERLELFQDVATDETGRARVRIRALSLAPNQTALIKITDLGSGAYQFTSFVIAQFTGGTPAFFAVPSAFTVTSSLPGQCAGFNALLANVVVFGGLPPYSIVSGSAGFVVSPSVVTASGEAFSVFGRSICVTDGPITITDASGRTITVTGNSNPGPTPVVPAFVVAPIAVTLATCSDIANVTVVGGTGSYFANASSASLLVTVPFPGNTVSIRRKPATASPGVAPVTLSVSVSDGTSVATVDVTLTGAGAGICP